MTCRMTEAQARALLGKHYKIEGITPKTKKPKETPEGEQILEQQLRFAGIAFEREFKFHAARKWRADFRITGKNILVEVEGGVYSNGRHNPISLSYTHPLAVMIDKADIRKKRRPTKLLVCRITDDEARAVQRILLDMLSNIDLDVSKWAWVLIQHYELGMSFGLIADLNNWAKTTVHRMVKKGLEHFTKIIFPVI